MMDFGEVLASSWRVFWKNKVLWLFGLIPPLVFVTVAAVGMLIVFNDRFLNSIFNANSFDPGITTGMVVFFVLFFLFWIVYMFVSFYADAAIVKGTLVFDQTGEKRSVEGLMRETQPYYWRVAVLMLLFSLAVGAVVILVWLFMFLITAVTLGMGAMCAMPLWFLIIPVNLLAITLIEMAKALLIQGNLAIGKSLKRAWALLKLNFWSVVLLILIQFAVSMAITSILYIPLYAIFFIPMMTMVNSSSAGSPDFLVRFFETMKWVYVVAMPILVLGQSLIQTYFRSLWTVATLRLAKRSGPAPTPAESPVQLGTI